MLKNWQLRNLLKIAIVTFLLYSCNDDNSLRTSCDMQKVTDDNTNKVTITNGIWGTVSSMEGNCMPSPGSNSSCIHCPIQRTIRIYEYTLKSNATQSDNYSSFYDSFNTPLIAEVDTDENGFFQIDIPAGHYSIVVVENGKLYASGLDGKGGINPIIPTSEIQNINLLMTYKAVF